MGWRVWGELRRRHHIELAWAELHGERARIDQLPGGWIRITLDCRLRADERRAALAHELVHDERGILFDDDTPLAIVRKEEALVQAEAVRRLVPPDALAELVRRIVEHDGQVTWREVAEAFQVPRREAQAALEQLERATSRRRHPTGR